MPILTGEGGIAPKGQRSEVSGIVLFGTTALMKVEAFNLQAGGACAKPQASCLPLYHLDH